MGLGLAHVGGAHCAGVCCPAMPCGKAGHLSPEARSSGRLPGWGVGFGRRVGSSATELLNIHMSRTTARPGSS